MDTDKPVTLATTEPEQTVPRERFLESQKNVGLLLQERARLVELIRELLSIIPPPSPICVTLAHDRRPTEIVARAKGYVLAFDTINGKVPAPPAPAPTCPPIKFPPT